jgi:hypothetical protein
MHDVFKLAEKVHRTGGKYCTLFIIPPAKISLLNHVFGSFMMLIAVGRFQLNTPMFQTLQNL